MNQILAVFSGSYVVVLGIYYKLQTFYICLQEALSRECVR